MDVHQLGGRPPGNQRWNERPESQADGTLGAHRCRHRGGCRLAYGGDPGKRQQQSGIQRRPQRLDRRRRGRCVRCRVWLSQARGALDAGTDASSCGNPADQERHQVLTICLVLKGAAARHRVRLTDPFPPLVACSRRGRPSRIGGAIQCAACRPQPPSNPDVYASATDWRDHGE